MRTSVLTGHDLVGVEALDGAYGTVSVCTCGWRSMPAGSAHAERRWQIHVNSTRATVTWSSAQNTMRRAQLRVDELARVREATRERRAAIHEARRRLASANRNVRKGSEPVRYARPTMLESARQMVGLSFANLWVAYFSLGGNLSPAELMSALRDSTLLPHWDLNLITLALNESFTEAGMGQPLDYWSAGA
jgi:hypothetical protein